MERRNNRYRYQLSLCADQRQQLHPLVDALCEWLEADKEARQVRWTVDIDPQDML